METRTQSNSGPAQGRLALPDARRRSRQRRSERGVALILVLGSLTIMAVVLSEFQDESSAEFGSALSYRDALKAEYAARSGIALSRLLIASEPTIRKDVAPMLQLALGAPTQIPVWEFAEDILGAFSDDEGGKRFTALTGTGLVESKNLGLDGASFQLQLVDEDAKLNLNKAAKGDPVSSTRLGIELLGLFSGPQYDPLFDQRDADNQFSSRQVICGAIVDWTDPDQEAYDCNPFSGQPPPDIPEDSFYQQFVSDPYPRKNGAFDSLEELRLVRGIGDDFWATFVEPDPYEHKSRVVTVWGQGAINVNTANAQTIYAYVCGKAEENTPLCTDPEMRFSFITVFSMLRSMISGVPLFGSPNVFVKTLQGGGMLGPIFEAMGIPPVVFKNGTDPTDGITTTSKVFSIVATGVVKAHKRQTRVRIHAVVDFRKAPAPWDTRKIYEAQQLQGIGDGSRFLPTAPTSPQGGDDNEELSPDRLGAALQPTPDGRVLHYRVN